MGVDVTDLALHDLRRLVAPGAQEAILFNRLVPGDNLRYGDLRPDPERGGNRWRGKRAWKATFRGFPGRLSALGSEGDSPQAAASANWAALRPRPDGDRPLLGAYDAWRSVDKTTTADAILELDP